MKGEINKQMNYKDDPKENLTRQLIVRFTEADYKKLNRLADSLNMVMAKMVRSWIKSILDKEE
jgi:hypothetical protein